MWVSGKLMLVTLSKACYKSCPKAVPCAIPPLHCLQACDNPPLPADQHQAVAPQRQTDAPGAAAEAQVTNTVASRPIQHARHSPGGTGPALHAVQPSTHAADSYADLSNTDQAAGQVADTHSSDSMVNAEDKSEVITVDLADSSMAVTPNEALSSIAAYSSSNGQVASQKTDSAIADDAASLESASLLHAEAQCGAEDALQKELGSVEESGTILQPKRAAGVADPGHLTASLAVNHIPGSNSAATALQGVSSASEASKRALGAAHFAESPLSEASRNADAASHDISSATDFHVTATGVTHCGTVSTEEASDASIGTVGEQSPVRAGQTGKALDLSALTAAEIAADDAVFAQLSFPGEMWEDSDEDDESYVPDDSAYQMADSASSSLKGHLYCQVSADASVNGDTSTHEAGMSQQENTAVADAVSDVAQHSSGEHYDINSIAADSAAAALSRADAAIPSSQAETADDMMTAASARDAVVASNSHDVLPHGSVSNPQHIEHQASSQTVSERSKIPETASDIAAADSRTDATEDAGNHSTSHVNGHVGSHVDDHVTGHVDIHVDAGLEGGCVGRADPFSHTAFLAEPADVFCGVRSAYHKALDTLDAAHLEKER